MLKRVVELPSLSRTHQLGLSLGDCLEPGDFIALDGELGVGKTELVRAVCERLGISPAVVCSPSFAVIASYGEGALPVAHVDLYRVADEDELYSTGYFDQLSGPGVVLVEWASRIPGALPERRLSLRLEATGLESRRMTAVGVGERHEALLEAWLGKDSSPSSPSNGTA